MRLISRKGLPSAPVCGETVFTMRAFLFAIIYLSLNVAAFSARDGKSLPPPRPNLPWEHEKTSFRLPAEIEGLTADEIFQLEEPLLGYSVKYVDTKARLVADIYVYPCHRSAKTADEIKEALSDSAGQAVWEVEEMGRRGHYKNVQRGDADYQPFDLIPENTGVSALLSVPLRYGVVEKTDAGESESKVGGHLAIMVFREHFIKVRLTYPIDNDEKDQEALEKRISDFVNKTRRCLLDTGMRDDIRHQVETYRKAPLAESGHDAAGAVLVYAEFTPLFELAVHGAIASMSEEMTKEYPEASEELIRAFIVGAVAEALKKPGTKPADLDQAAATEMLRTFAAMQKARPALKNTLMDELQKAVNEKHAAAWFRTQSAPKEKP